MDWIKSHPKTTAGLVVGVFAWGYWKIKRARAAPGTAISFDVGEFASGVLSQPGAILKAAFTPDAQLASTLATTTTTTEDQFDGAY